MPAVETRLGMIGCARRISSLPVKPGSHLCDKHNTSDISISISTRKKEQAPFFLCLCLMLMSLVLCLSHKCEPGFSKKKPVDADAVKSIINRFGAEGTSRKDQNIAAVTSLGFVNRNSIEQALHKFSRTKHCFDFELFNPSISS